MTKGHRGTTPASGRGESAAAGPRELRAALLANGGGAGAELRGHVPADPLGAVLLLHGGAERDSTVVTWWRLAVLRMAPFASVLRQRAGDHLAVLRLKNRVRGWNGVREDPLTDARWALDRVRRVLPGLPVVVVGHSMGGRVALQLSNEPGVAGVAALAPWVESDVSHPRPGVAVLLAHGSRDRVTDPRRTEVLARRFTDTGVDLRYVLIEGGTHAMVHDAALWHDTVSDFVIDVLLAPGRTS